MCPKQRAQPLLVGPLYLLCSPISWTRLRYIDLAFSNGFQKSSTFRDTLASGWKSHLKFFRFQCRSETFQHWCESGSIEEISQLIPEDFELCHKIGIMCALSLNSFQHCFCCHKILRPSISMQLVLHRSIEWITVDLELWSWNKSSSTSNLLGKLGQEFINLFTANLFPTCGTYLDTSLVLFMLLRLSWWCQSQ